METTPSIFEGIWENVEGKQVAIIRGDRVEWFNGPSAHFSRRADDEIAVMLEGMDGVSAKCDSDGRLLWSDGDIWVRAASEAVVDSTTSEYARRPGLKAQSQQSFSPRAASQRAFPWQGRAGSGGAGGGDSTALAKSSLKAKKMERMGLAMSQLLPLRAERFPPQNYCTSTILNIACYPNDGCRFTYDAPEESDVRCMMAHDSDPPVLMVEFNHLVAYNMMDVVFQTDLLWTLSTVHERYQRTIVHDRPAYAAVMQGAGPHFCPGGNPNPMISPGTGMFDYNQYTGYFAFVRIREAGVPTVVGVHGATAGGGCAQSLNQSRRTCEVKNTICFGNVSRGAVPGMMLSRNIVTCLGNRGALDMYLGDHTYSSFGGVAAGYYMNVFKGIAETKMYAQDVARRLGKNPICREVLPHMLNYIDEERYSIEGHAIAMAGRQEGLFSNVDVKKAIAAKKSIADRKAEEERKVRERYGEKPEGMPNKLPGQHPKFLSQGQQAICSQCGITATNGLYVRQTSGSPETFYCMDCWNDWSKVDDAGEDAKKKKGKKGKKEEKEPPKEKLATQPPPDMFTLAQQLHGPGVDGGILSWATWSSKCCWACHKDFKESDGFKVEGGGKAVYCTIECKKRHNPAAIASKDVAQSSKTVDVGQLAEGASFAMWRERCVGSGVKEIRPPVPFAKLDETDARVALQSEEKMKLQDAELPLLIVEHGEPSPNAVLFNDPAELFKDDKSLWWQFLGTEASKTAAGLVLSALIAVLAKGSGFSLSLNGRNVKNFGLCSGKYKGPVKNLAVEDYSRNAIFPVPRRTPEGELSKHYWVFVQTDSGDEYCIDLAAAQYGDSSLGKAGCPLIFKPKKEFDLLYEETDRSWDPIEAYRELFKDMMEEKISKMKDKGSTPWYKRANNVEVFVHISSKLCSLLGLV